MDRPKLTRKEEQAITRLEKLASTWPKSLTLFSQSGSLFVLKLPEGATGSEILRYEVAHIAGIPNDGGDADY